MEREWHQEDEEERCYFWRDIGGVNEVMLEKGNKEKMISKRKTGKKDDISGGTKESY